MRWSGGARHSNLYAPYGRGRTRGAGFETLNVWSKLCCCGVHVKYARAIIVSIIPEQDPSPYSEHERESSTVVLHRLPTLCHSATMKSPRARHLPCQNLLTAGALFPKQKYRRIDFRKLRRTFLATSDDSFNNFNG